MRNTKDWRLVLATGLFLGLAPVAAFAHGDVTPHPIDTSSLKPLGNTWATQNPYRGNKQAVAVGATGYYHNCAECHGLNAEAGGMAPDLLAAGQDCLDMAKTQQASCLKDTDDDFKDAVLNGRKNSEGRVVMPAYGKVFTQEAVWAVKAYIDSRTAEEHAKGSN